MATTHIRLPLHKMSFCEQRRSVVPGSGWIRLQIRPGSPGCLQETRLHEDPNGLQPFWGVWIFEPALGELQTNAREHLCQGCESLSQGWPPRLCQGCAA